MKNLIQHALNSIFEKITGNKDDFNLEVYKKIKGQKSAKGIASILLINEAMLDEFEVAVADFYKFKEDNKKSKIVSFRLALWLETICKNLNINFNIEEAISNEELAIKQVRALELIIRDIVNDNLGGKENVLLKLQELFKQEIVDKWLKSGDETGVLSGTTFSELSNIFLDKNIFKGLQEIFDSSNLYLNGNSRETLRKIFEDIRRIRNIVAHNKKISQIQIESLNQFYITIASIIEDSQLINLTPSNYLNSSAESIEGFVKSLKEDNDQILGNLESISLSLEKGFSSLEDKTDEIQKELKTSWISKKSVILISVILFLILIISFSLYSYQTRPINSTIKLEWSSKDASYSFDDLKEVRIITDHLNRKFEINSDGTINLIDVDFENLENKIKLEFQNANIIQINDSKLLRSELIPIKLQIKDLDRVSFLIRDSESGAPVNGAKVSFPDFNGISNEFGEVSINIPLEKQSKFIDIKIIKTGYKLYKLNDVLVNSNIPVELLLNK